MTSHFENIIVACRFRLRGMTGFAVRGAPVLTFALMAAGCLATSSSDATDPVAVENPVVFVKRPLLFADNSGMLLGDNLAEPAAFRPGARLFLKDRASPDAVVKDISSRAFAAGQSYDVKDPSVSFDGTRVVFAMRAPDIENADDEDQPTWNLWEYDYTEDRLTRLISSDVTAAEGEDIAPAYLPDERIVFASTRQQRSGGILNDEGKPQYPGLEEEREVPAFVLHVLDRDTETVEQITFNQSHDLDPLMQDDGTILFSRWDNAGQTRNNGFNLYRVNPDGTGLTYIYGRHSHNSVSADTGVEYLRPRMTDSGRILVELRPLETDNFGTVPTTVDTLGFVEADRAIDGSMGAGQSPLVSGLSIGDGVSLSGNYGSVSPLLDGSNRYLASWSPCRLRLTDGDGTIVNCTSERVASGNYEAAEPVYGLWLLDTTAQTQRPVEQAAEGQQFDEAVLMRERPLADFIPEAQYTGDDATRADNGFGVIEIRSVYDVDGIDVSPLGIPQTADPGQRSPDNLPRRFLRIEKPVSIPGEEVLELDDIAFGPIRDQSMREILGYVPIEPDGSVRVAVPANVAFAISVLDDEGQRIGPRHQNWLALTPGETVTCNGCHNPDSDVAHGRPDASPDSVYGGAPTTGIPFPNTDSALFTDIGETMAQTWARINGTRELAPNLIYEDQWTDSSNQTLTPGTPIDLSYANLATPVPITEVCDENRDGNWARACRIVINYEQHIHPLWDLEREVLIASVPTDVTCTGCHTNEDAVGAARVPDEQLDLTGGASDQEPDQFKAYRELLFNDNAQILDGNTLRDEMIDSGEILRDEEGEPILDADGNEQPILVPVPVPRSMSAAGARQSDAFFDLFRDGGAHEGYLSPAELRLLSEWLDIGAQYYNNPFDAAAD